MRTVRLLAGAASLLMFAAAAGAQSTSIASNFNGTAVTSPEYIWFTSHMTNLTGVPLSGGTLYFTNQTITIFDSSLPGGSVVLAVPNGSITINPTISSPTITFDAAGSHTLISGIGNDPILSVLSWQVPAFPTGINLSGANPVTWAGDVSVSWLPTSTVTMNWQWAAAAYTPFTSNYSALGVLATDQGGMQSGTPTNYISGAVACINAGSGNNCLAGGARGGGGSNYTGSNSGTASLVVTNVVPEPTTFMLFGSGLLGLGTLQIRRRRK